MQYAIRGTCCNLQPPKCITDGKDIAMQSRGLAAEVVGGRVALSE
jgi:hypothetical protein